MCMLVLRYRTPEHPARIAAIVVAFGAACLAFSFMWQFPTPWWAKLLTGVPVLILFSFLVFLKSVDVPETFKCPLVPLVPSIGVLVNIYLITSLPIEAFYRVLVWTAIGLAIYFGYGIRNSALRFQATATSKFIPGDDDEVDALLSSSSATSRKAKASYSDGDDGDDHETNGLTHAKEAEGRAASLRNAAYSINGDHLDESADPARTKEE